MGLFDVAGADLCCSTSVASEARSSARCLVQPSRGSRHRMQRTDLQPQRVQVSRRGARHARNFISRDRGIVNSSTKAL